jgi:hypothetical protein
VDQSVRMTMLVVVVLMGVVVRMTVVEMPCVDGL